MTFYNLQQVLRMFGYVQGAVQISGDIATSSHLVVEAKFVGKSSYLEVRGYSAQVAGASLSHVAWGFVLIHGGNEESSMEIPIPFQVMANDPFLRIRKRMGPHWTLA